jgi:hypothetical protein
MQDQLRADLEESILGMSGLCIYMKGGRWSVALLTIYHLYANRVNA